MAAPLLSRAAGNWAREKVAAGAARPDSPRARALVRRREPARREEEEGSASERRSEERAAGAGRSGERTPFQSRRALCPRKHDRAAAARVSLSGKRIIFLPVQRAVACFALRHHLSVGSEERSLTRRCLSPRLTGVRVPRFLVSGVSRETFGNFCLALVWFARTVARGRPGFGPVYGSCARCVPDPRDAGRTVGYECRRPGWREGSQVPNVQEVAHEAIP